MTVDYDRRLRVVQRLYDWRLDLLEVIRMIPTDLLRALLRELRLATERVEDELYRRRETTRELDSREIGAA